MPNASNRHKHWIRVPSPPSVPQGAHAGNDRPPDQLSVDGKITELKFHAKGGLGVVYVAKDQRLQRQVAVKFIHEHLLDNDECRQRFELEAEVTGRLEHPGVVPLYGVGRDEHQRLFYYMRYIDGTTLEESIRKLYGIEQSLERSDWQGLEFRRLLTSFVSVCKTVAYAHNRGIVHRDLKPDNVMLGRFGETIVVDWGLAVPVVRDERFRISGEHTLLPASGSGSGSSSGQGVGTPAYMSPEQTSGLAPTPASDVYSLGATLYKIITAALRFSRRTFTISARG